MKLLALTAGALLAGAATLAQAQLYYDPYPRDYGRGDDQECWNPRAGHYERVRPNEYQDDLDFRRCRLVGYGDKRFRDERGYRRHEWRERRGYREECWNPDRNHYEEARRGEFQGDLDYSRCRPMN